MKITNNDDYTIITLQSELLTDWTNVTDVTLTSTIDCGTTKYTDTIVQGDVDAEGLFTVDLNALLGTETPSDGIYSFVLSVTVESDSTKISTDYACLFVDNNLKCEVAECVKNSSNIELQLDYYILSRASGCECQCADLCVIYNRIKNELTCC